MAYLESSRMLLFSIDLLIFLKLCADDLFRDLCRSKSLDVFVCGHGLMWMWEVDSSTRITFIYSLGLEFRADIETEGSPVP